MWTAVTKLENLNGITVIGSQGSRSQVAALNCQSQGVVTIMDSRQSSKENSLICIDIWHWLVNHTVPRSETEKSIGSLLTSYLIYKQEGSRSGKQKSNLSHQNSHGPSISSQS